MSYHEDIVDKTANDLKKDKKIVSKVIELFFYYIFLYKMKRLKKFAIWYIGKLQPNRRGKIILRRKKTRWNVVHQNRMKKYMRKVCKKRKK